MFSWFFFCLFVLSDGDPKNYMAFYRRATVYLAMGKSKAALPDLSRVIELKPDFTSVSFFGWKNFHLDTCCPAT